VLAFGFVGGLGNLALAQVDRVAVIKAQAHDKVAAATGEHPREADARLDVHAAAVLGHAEAHVNFFAIAAGAHDVVDHAGDRVGAVDGGGAVPQHFDLLGEGRQDVDVDGRNRAGGERLRRHAAAVEQHEGVAGAETAERGIGIVAAAGDGVDGRLILREVRDVRDAGELVERRDGITCLELLARDDGDGQGLLDVDPLDIRTRDRERFELDRSGGWIFVIRGDRRGGLSLENNDGQRHRNEYRDRQKASGPGRAASWGMHGGVESLIASSTKAGKGEAARNGFFSGGCY